LKINGIEKFREKVPIFAGKKIIILPIYSIIILLIGLVIQLWFDILAVIIPSNGIFGYIRPIYPILGVLIMLSFALLSVFQMWHRRDKLKAKYGPISYQKSAIIGFAGISIMFSLVIHNFISNIIWHLPLGDQSHIWILTTPITVPLPGFQELYFYIRLVLTVSFMLLGALIIFRAIKTFGFDYMAVIYLYFPEESELQNHEIYSVLRHPTYAGLILMNFAGLIFSLNLYSISFFLAYLVGFYIHIHFVEEKELIQRFGGSYRDYQKQTPAIIVKPKNLPKLLKFILGKS
jgi:protein-S-isoprenylcysteine O-methyltransferase Ste14